MRQILDLLQMLERKASFLATAILALSPFVAHADEEALDSPLQHLEHPQVAAGYVKNQGGVGFCWAYSLSGYLESQLIARDGKSPSLSEEYSGFYHLFKQLRNPSPQLQLALLQRDDRWDTGVTWLDKIPFFFSLLNLLNAAPIEGNFLNVALDEMEYAGVVPETVFKHKFSDDKLAINIKRFLVTKYAVDPDFFQKNELKLFDELATIYGATPPKPNDSFTWEGKSYTPLTFLHDFIGFRRADYHAVEAVAGEQDESLQHVRKLLADGKSVPLSFAILNDPDVEKQGRFSTKRCATQPCQSNSRHAVLAVASAVKPTTGLVVKNSWGATGLRLNKSKPDKQFADVSEPSGYYFIEDDYLKAGFNISGAWAYVERVDEAEPPAVGWSFPGSFQNFVTSY